jgi:hypothetical protein
VPIEHPFSKNKSEGIGILYRYLETPAALPDYDVATFPLGYTCCPASSTVCSDNTQAMPV